VIGRLEVELIILPPKKHRELVDRIKALIKEMRETFPMEEMIKSGSVDLIENWYEEWLS